VIDGLLHHESDLSIEEHYTDTAGYTDQVFRLSLLFPMTSLYRWEKVRTVIYPNSQSEHL